MNRVRKTKDLKLSHKKILAILHLMTISFPTFLEFG